MTPNNLPYRIHLRTISDVTHLNFASPYAQGLRACQWFILVLNSLGRLIHFEGILKPGGLETPSPPHLPMNTITILRNQLKIDKSTSFSPVAPPQYRQGNQVFEYR
ncbi:hypothetical protein PILCRDRAFT_823064 [Piloderma croceum F 1598]|uniref:Uncharacterized protein n=1 Tax=Piloderma croceum (strain F 1598) TaxID=765440 RepID=A0A0C3BRB3_PILCF|nr:hypothetical protein PILCRDRAFT_823064 [Piloderma croceum F 1598]